MSKKISQIILMKKSPVSAQSFVPILFPLFCCVCAEYWMAQDFGEVVDQQL